jgi:16S rRNA (uracil1498-N3)-methyltransferase
VSRAALRVPLDGITEGERELPEETARYVARVHRRAVGDELLAFDPERAIEAEGVVVAVGKSHCRVRFEAPRPASRTAARSVTLVQCVGKGDKLDAVVRDATELSATRVVPAVAERSVSQPSTARADRLRRIALEAARQSGRGDAPSVEPPMPLTEALARFVAPPPGLSLVLDPEASEPAGPRLVALAATSAPLVFVVGPEGGLSEDELREAERLGYARVSLGPVVLRTETVCAAVLGAVLALSAGRI